MNVLNRIYLWLNDGEKYFSLDIKHRDAIKISSTLMSLDPEFSNTNFIITYNDKNYLVVMGWETLNVGPLEGLDKRFESILKNKKIARCLWIKGD